MTTFTAPTEDIPIQDGTFAFSFFSSGNVSAGQGVYLCGPAGYVRAPEEDVDKNGIGVAAYGATAGEALAVYVPGNITRCEISGTQLVGTVVKLGKAGQMWALGCSGRDMGIIVDASDDQILII